MFVAKIDIWPHGQVYAQFNHTTIAGYNDGTGTSARGNYSVYRVPESVVAEGDTAVYIWTCQQQLDGNRGARVENFPRGHDQHHLPALVAQCIEALGMNEFLART